MSPVNYSRQLLKILITVARKHFYRPNWQLQGTHLHTTSLWKSFQNWWQNAKVLYMSDIL